MLTGKRVIVTGAASGMGRGIAELFAERGAKVLLTDIQVEAVEKVAAEIGAAGLACDVTVAAQVQQAVATAVKRFGGLDVMVNNAGVEYVAPFLDHDDGEFNRVLSVNLTGVYFGIKYAAPAIGAAGGGSIINIGSIGGLRGLPLHAAYAASKAGVISLTQTAALELRPLGLRVNAILPGVIDTPMAQASAPALDAMTRAMAGISFDEFVRGAQGRWGTPHDIASAAAFLASDDSSLINGISISVDGGISAKVL